MSENEAALGINVLYIAYIENILKHILSDIKRLDICYVEYTKFVQIMVLWSKWHRSGDHRVYEAVIVL